MALFGKDHNSDSDEHLLNSYLRTRRTEPLGLLYNRYIPLIYGVCLKYLRNSADAEDAVMQIFEDVAARIDRYEIKCFRAWIYTVTRNHCLQLLRKGNSEQATDFATENMESEPVLDLTDVREERLTAMEECIKQLPDPQRRCIELFYFGQKSYADIADLTEWHLKSVKSYIQNGKRNLKICMEHNNAID